MITEIQKKYIKKRSRTLKAVRDFFWSQNYIEIDSPIAVEKAGQEPYLHPVPLEIADDKGVKRKFFLHTSPEYAMKKILGAGFEKIFQITHCFRDRESFGGTHQPEFSMLEWYRTGADLESMMDETENLMKSVSEALGEKMEKPRRFSVSRLFKEYVGADLDKIMDTDKIYALCRTFGFKISPEGKFEDYFFAIFLNKIEPFLNEDFPIFVHRYPSQLAALSELDAKNPKYALRFEVYWRGFEIANAFQELLDPVEQKARFESEQRIKAEMGGPQIPIDEELLEAIGKIPRPTSGIALGIDRLIMAISKENDIANVVAFPFTNK